MTPYYTDESVTLHHGDALAVLRNLPAGSVDCCVTSPPYYGLRDYGEPGQYGLESSPAEYVETMRAVFAEVRRVLADDGTLWLNLGDSYANRMFVGRKDAGRDFTGGGGNRLGSGNPGLQGARVPVDDLPAKNLLGMPWRVAFALQDDDSADIYELKDDAPEAVFLETCRIRTLRPDAHITASTQSGGAKPTQSSTRPDGQHGTPPTERSSADTAASTTSSTASRKSSGRSAATPDAIAGCDSQHCSTTAANSRSAPAAESGTSPSSPLTTSTAAEANTESCSALQASTSGSTCAESPTRPASVSSAITATRPAATTDRARTRTRLPKSQIPPDLLPHFRLVKQERWILRNCVVWDKPNAMPESVTDRLSTTYEMVFLLAKSRRYWFDLDAVREPAVISGGATWPQRKAAGEPIRHGLMGAAAAGAGGFAPSPSGRNPGDVWTIPTTPFPEAHFACMAPELARRCIVAGCKTGGVVLDPFCGSGTTGMVAQQHGRRFVGIDLNREYLDLALRTRLAQAAIVDGTR